METNKEQNPPSHAGCLTRSQWLDNKSRMKEDLHVRIYENLELKCSGLLDNGPVIDLLFYGLFDERMR